jgi:methylmalonyl-CoA mutase
MTDQLLSLSNGFDEATEADWLEGVTKALKGGGIERITRQTRDGIAIKPLYRETDFTSSENTRGTPGSAPFLRGANAEPDAYLPWDIRQRFTHPDPATTNAEILRDLERGVSSIEIAIECSGTKGVQLCDLPAFETALEGVRPDLATIALDHQGAGTGASAAGLLALWAETYGETSTARLAFNLDPLGTLARMAHLGGGLDAVFAKTAAVVQAFAERFPLATTLRIDGRPVHEAGGTEAQELGALLANAIDTLRRLEAAGLPRTMAASQFLFTMAVDGNYGMGIAKLRAARRLWAKAQDVLGIEPTPMKLQAMTSARMLTRFDPWVNMLRGTASCFAGAVGGADTVTVRPFNEALGMPEELGRRVARNTQIMAMEESGLGRVADPSGGAWFSETLSEDLAKAAWAEFQSIEREGGYGQSLIKGAIQSRVSYAKASLLKAVAKRKVPVTGVSEFPLLEGVDAPVAIAEPAVSKGGVDPAGLEAFIPDFTAPAGDDVVAEKLVPMSIAAPFEALRERAERHLVAKGSRPSIFIATLGPLAEHNARVDFARNLFAAGGIEAKEQPIPPENAVDIAAAFRASGCSIAVICGADKRYGAEAAEAAGALKASGATHVWIAGKFEADGIDRQIFMGCDVVHETSLAQAELGV